MSHDENFDDLIAATDMLRVASAERRKAQDQLDTAVAREHDAALRVAELRSKVSRAA